MLAATIDPGAIPGRRVGVDEGSPGAPVEGLAPGRIRGGSILVGVNPLIVRDVAGFVNSDRAEGLVGLRVRIDREGRPGFWETSDPGRRPRIPGQAAASSLRVEDLRAWRAKGDAPSSMSPYLNRDGL